MRQLLRDQLGLCRHRIKKKKKNPDFRVLSLDGWKAGVLGRSAYIFIVLPYCGGEAVCISMKYPDQTCYTHRC